MAISLELENAIRGSIHSASGALELIDLCNNEPFNASVSDFNATSATINAAVMSALTAGSAVISTNLTVRSVCSASSITGAAGNITALTAAALVNTNLTALTGVIKSIDCSVGMTAAALTAGSAVISTNMTVRSVMSASSVTAAAGNITALSAANAVIGTNVTVGSVMSASSITGAAGNITALTVGKPSIGLHAAGLTGGTHATSAQAITNGAALLAFTASSNNFYALPAPSVGLGCDVINRVGSTAALVANNATQSIQGATSFSVATSNAVGGAPSLICDGTNWFVRGQ